ncbi:MAG TPA: TadE family protein [Candidatus Dormibacteraeota bacterium]|nr:TadE family protein [Candidatus Dormibacteraeota bacterium]
MNLTIHRPIHRAVPKKPSGERGAQLAELALVLPVLALLAVGVWDFGSAFGLKQKLTNAAREGARIVVSNSIIPTPSCGPGTNPPCSIAAAEQAVVQYMSEANLNAACLSSATPFGTYPTWTWSCQGITLTINRGAGAGLDTAVSLTYPVQWSMHDFFGATVVPNQITTQVTMPNLTY